jgi:predicted HicB family RNase H-like nuclease
MRKTETLNLRVSHEFKRRLIEEAKKEKRSVTNYLEVILIKLWKQKASSNKGVGKVKDEDSDS